MLNYQKPCPSTDLVTAPTPVLESNKHARYVPVHQGGEKINYGTLLTMTEKLFYLFYDPPPFLRLDKHDIHQGEKITHATLLSCYLL